MTTDEEAGLIACLRAFVRHLQSGQPIGNVAEPTDTTVREFARGWVSGQGSARLYSTEPLPEE